MYPYEYSDKEIQLIEAINFQDIAKNPNVPPTLLYNALAVECFRRNKNDNVENSVRRCLLALEDSCRRDSKNPIFRGTKEFDDLIVI